MSAIAGYKGAAKVGGTNEVQELQKWSLDAEVAMLEDTALRTPNGAKTYIPGLFGASGSFEANYSKTDVGGQQALISAFFARTTVQLELDLGEAGDGTLSGTAYINKFSPSVDVGDKTGVKYEFTFTGAVSYA